MFSEMIRRLYLAWNVIVSGWEIKVPVPTASVNKETEEEPETGTEESYW